MPDSELQFAPMDGAARNRVKLWLRSEKAMGLPSVVAAAADFVGMAPPPAETVPDECAAEDCGAATRPAPQPAAPVVPPPAAAGGGGPYGATDLFAPAASQPGFGATPLAPEQKRQRLVALNENEVRGCTKCRLCETRTQTVFGEGDSDAKIFFIGEGPGENEDLTGRPFVGRAGEMLNRWIAAMGLRREQVYIANIVKCRPPGNRVPAPDEVATCTPYLQRQLEIIRPKVIVTLGLPSAKYMLQSNSTMGRLRGQWHEWRGIKLMPTFHPAYVLRSYTQQVRAAVWDDLKKVMAELGLPPPKLKTPS
jgi:DNA polymerase